MVHAEFFLGGRDLEMVTIAQLLLDSGCSFHDAQLNWGGKASYYQSEIESAISNQQSIVLVELIDDIDLAKRLEPNQLIVVDHHGAKAGKTAPTSLEQVFELLALPSSKWTRWMQLVAANDRGHVSAMLEIDATLEEVQRARQADRQAQGVTSQQEHQGQLAIKEAQSSAGGQLTVVRLPHSRCATVTDSLDQRMGGPGFKNLLVISPNQLNFYGAGFVIQQLVDKFPAGWYGGELPDRGFWGTEGYPEELIQTEIQDILLNSGQQ